MKRTNIVLDDKLVASVKRQTGLRTTRRIVEFALSELVRRGEQKKLLLLAGQGWTGNLSRLRRGRAC